MEKKWMIPVEAFCGFSRNIVGFKQRFDGDSECKIRERKKKSRIFDDFRSFYEFFFEEKGKRNMNDDTTCLLGDDVRNIFRCKAKEPYL